MRDYHDYTEKFEALAIDPHEFAHIDHVGVAYVILNKYAFLKACTIYAQSIDALAKSVGADTKFNTTITLAFLSIMSERIAHSDAGDFAEFLDQNPDLMDRGLLGRWYSSDRLRSDTARNVFLMPNLAA